MIQRQISRTYNTAFNVINNRPHITMIAVDRALQEEELQRQLAKPDCKYTIMRDELQSLIFPYISEQIVVRKVALYSELKNKIKVIFFI